MTPDELNSQAEELTRQLLSMPMTQMDSELCKLKREDPVLHALVLSKMRDMREL